MADLLTTIKQAAADAIRAQNPTAILYGKVTKIEPLEVNVNQRLNLPAALLVVPESLTAHKIIIGDQSFVIRQGLKIGDSVLLIRVQGGQQYVIFDKVVM